jgi:hypothetical protein
MLEERVNGSDRAINSPMIFKKYRLAVVVVFGSVSCPGKPSDTAQALADTIHHGLRSGGKFARFTLYGCDG